MPRASPSVARLEANLVRLSLGEREALIRIVVSGRARRISLRASCARRELILTLPRGVTPEAAFPFLKAQRRWIAARLAHMPQGRAFAHGGQVPLRGVLYTIRSTGGYRGLVAVAAGEEGPEILVPGPCEHLARRVTHFLAAEARKDILAAVARFTAAIGRPARRVRLGDPTSRWGSCSSQGALFFSWRLVMAPPPVLTYLVAHEVAHLVEMNHSPRFWALVRSLDPDMEASRAWLARHGAELHAWGAEG